MQRPWGDDLDLNMFSTLGEVQIYGYSNDEEVLERTRDADVIILNKCEINERTIGKAEKLKLVCVTATGTNNLDKDYLKEKNIEWRNVAGYSTESVAQHTFAMLFYLLEKLAYYDQYVKKETYVEDKIFTHFKNNFHEINGQTWGIVGMGAIGSRVAEIAKTFGCKVIYYSTSGKNHNQPYESVSFKELLNTADIITIHAPLTESTQNLFDASAFKEMKKDAILLNLGRGPIVNEKDLCEALQGDVIKAAGLDVLSKEPMARDNPLIAIKDSEKLLITPHIAWASVEARVHLMSIIHGQIKEFFDGKQC